MGSASSMMLSERARVRSVGRQRIARLAWLYAFLLSISTLTLGVFVVAFIASLKNDALLNPTELGVDQLKPGNWIAAWRLGADGGRSTLLGGLAADGVVALTLTFATTSAEKFATPIIQVPAIRTPDSLGQEPLFDAILVSEARVVGEDRAVSYEEISGTLVTAQNGVSRSWRVEIKNAARNMEYVRVPLTVLAPKGQVLIDSDLPPSRTERRGRVSSWDNIAPGFIGYVFSNYVRVIDDTRSLESGDSLFLVWTFNSFFIAIFKVLLTLTIACTGGYALARFRFPGSRLLFYALLLSMTVPAQLLFISNYLIYRDIGLLNTPWAVITAVVASAQVLIMKQFFESIPKEVEEAAIVDGATPISILTNIFLPMSKPAIATVTILGFQSAWNDFFWPLVVLTSPAEAYTLPVGLLSLRNVYGNAGDWGLILAGSFLSVIPVLLVFIFFQRYFVESDSFAAVKG